MSVIPLHVEKRFELRWAARFGSLLIPTVSRSVGLSSLTGADRVPVTFDPWAPRKPPAGCEPAGRRCSVRRVIHGRRFGGDLSSGLGDKHLRRDD
jgi:hypothetical protein